MKRVAGVVATEESGTENPADAVWERAPRLRASSVTDLQPKQTPRAGSNGMEHVFGHWPGEESDEEVQAALEALE